MSADSRCPACGQIQYPDDRFCVGCGARAAVSVDGPEGGTRALAALETGLLSAVRPCPACGQAVYADNRFCQSCGYGQPAGQRTAPAAADRPEGGLATATGLSCRQCGAELYPDDNFCVGCGATSRAQAVEVPAAGGTRVVAALRDDAETPATACASCGVATLPHHRFCQHCGASVAGAPETPAEPARAGTPVADVVLPPDDAWVRVRRRLEQAFLGELDIAQELGRGGMAAVFLAHDLSLNRKVAVKVMAPGLLTGPGMVERFRREAVTVAGLRHPHIVSIHAVRHVDDLHCIVMEFIDGNSLEHVLRAVGPLPVDAARVILFQAGSALAYAHRRGVVHRDVKLANILLDSDGNAVIMDFGIAKVAEEPGQTQTGVAVGTPAYMSPEQCYGAEVTAASDQYSLGIVAYELLAGRKPFEGTPFTVMQAHTRAPPPPLRALRGDCPPGVEAAVLRMLAKRPEERFPSLLEAMDGLGARALAASDPLRDELMRMATATASNRAVPAPITPVSPIPGTHAASPRAAPRRRATLLASVAVAVLAVGGGAALWLAKDGAVAGGAADSTSAGPPADTPPALPPPAADPASATPPPSVAAPSRGGVSLTVPRRVLDIGESLPLAAVVADSTGARVSGAAVQWRSSDPVRVDVGPDGRVTARQPGRARITASSGSWSTTVDLTVRLPRITRIVLVPAPGPLAAGRSVDITASVEPKRTGVANPALVWRSSNPAVATIAAGDSLRARVTLVAAGDAVITAEAEGVTGSATLAVQPAAALELARSAVSFAAVSDGAAPADETIALTVAGDGTVPAVRAPEYTSGASGWLTPIIQGSTLTLRASPRGIPAGTHRAQVAVTAAGISRTVTVDFRVTAAVVTDPVAGARPAIEALLEAYQRALNSGDAAGVSRAFPAIPKRDLEALMNRPVSDRVEILLRSGSLKPGSEPNTMEGEVTSGMLGDREGRIARFVYVFERSATGWIIRSTRQIR